MSDIEDFEEGGGEYGEDWMYVEDHWDEAVDLAEYTCPSPPPVHQTVPLEEYDVHDYWQDIEYISDGGYYEDHTTPNKKRKRIQNLRKAPKTLKKRRKVLHGYRQPTLGISPIKWVAQKDRNHLLVSELSHDPSVPTREPIPSVSLLQNWQEKFKDTRGISTTTNPTIDHPDQVDNFDLSDLQSIAELLTTENMEALQQILEAKGVNPDALKMVMEDLLDGKERTFEDDEDMAEDEEEEDLPDQESDQQNSDQVANQSQDREGADGHNGGHDDSDRGISERSWQLEAGGNSGRPNMNDPSFSSSSEIQPRVTRSKRKARSDHDIADETSVRGAKKHRRHL